jgi:hypothetical protein
MWHVLDTDRGLDGSHRARTTYPYSTFGLDVESKSTADGRFTMQTYLSLLEFYELSAYKQSQPGTCQIVSLG